MESLLQNLHEQQIQLQQQMRIHDLSNMENLNDGNPPQPPPRKYVSIFRIDGEPILPPLMTTEKRRQMEIIKDKAIKIEQRLRDRKQGLNVAYYRRNDDINRESEGNISQRLQSNSENKLKETEESMAILQELIQRQKGGREEKYTETSTCSEDFYKEKSQEKLQKLQKSDILIYDNSTNEVMQLPAENVQKTKQMEWQESLKFVQKKIGSPLLLPGVDSSGVKSIPSICINPPTPLTVNKNFCDTLSNAESDESFINSTNLNESLNFGQNLSSDESFNSMITQSDIKSNRNTQHRGKIANKTENAECVSEILLTPVKNVCEKIQRYECISSESNTPQTSPQKLYKNRKISLRTPTGTMNRSATSPSIKICTSNRSSSSRSQTLVQDSDNSPENSNALVRSSSFTLEGPSKALIEHMQQQNILSNNKVAVQSPLKATQILPRKVLSSPIRAHRDTVESKAKKVQKVELKPSKQKMQQKCSQSKLVKTPTIVPISPNNNISTLSQHVNNLCKIKRSPYETSTTSRTTTQTFPKKSPNQMHNLSSTSSNLFLNKTSKTILNKSFTSTSSNSARTPKSDKEPLNQMDKIQKQKFLKLLVQQEEEHRKLQHSFEMQQKLLIEELKQEIVTYQSKHPIPTSLRKRPVQQQISPVCSFHPTRPQSSSSISNNSNSSYISFDKKQSLTLKNSHQNSSYATHYNLPSPQPFHLNNSHLSSTDHSNANTSLDISMLSMQTSHDTPCETPTNQNTAVVHNTPNNKTTSSSSSRRRLFVTEINDAARNEAYSPTFVDERDQSQQHNHIDDSNKRSQFENALIWHAAATKINAYARGFLVRRLFQTEQIQRIVQTIRDTLIFVITLHIETIENPEEAQTPVSIELKARLLQQLSSACRTLHLTFFQTSIKERMEIIARDRKLIKNKLISMNRKR